MKRLVKDLENKLSISKDYIFKTLKIQNKNIELIFNEVLTDTLMIDDFILRRLINIKNKKDLKHLENILPNTSILTIKKEDIIYYINYGFVVIICSKKLIYAVEVKADLARGINTIESEISIKGPKDSFNENYNTNLGLIRRRIKSEHFKVKSLEIGRSTKTKIGLLYMDNICEEDLLKDVYKKLKKIDIDGIIDSTYLKNTLEAKSNNFFPTIVTTERPDRISMALLEGKVCILTDMSPQVIILPNFFIDFFHTADDYYQKSVNITFIRILRLIAFFISIFLPAYYIAIITHNQNAIPVNLLLNLKVNSQNTPFPIFLEALMMIISFEILKESDIRMSSTTGSAISILGGLILGDALVNAGIMSPMMIIIIALSAISSLVFNEIEIVNAIRAWRFILIITSSLLGIYGIYLAFIVMLSKLTALYSFNKPYLYPFSPFNLRQQLDAFIKTNPKKPMQRNPLLTKNINRGGYE